MSMLRDRHVCFVASWRTRRMRRKKHGRIASALPDDEHGKDETKLDVLAEKKGIVDKTWNRRELGSGWIALGLAFSFLVPKVMEAKQKNAWIPEEISSDTSTMTEDWIRTKEEEILLEEERIFAEISDRARQEDRKERLLELAFMGGGISGMYVLAREWMARQPKPVETIVLDEGTDVGKKLLLVAGASCIPHPDKQDTGGEDAFFVSDAKQGSVGVADGVGGWSSSGVDSGEYSKTLMRLCREQFETADVDDPYQLLRTAHQSMDLPGSTTACVLTMRGDELLASNIGDSGFRIIRDGSLVYASPALLHSFNCPYQLASRSYVPYADSAASADRFSIRLKDQDIIVLATDGVFDNLFDQQLVSIVNEFDLEDSPASAAACASKIVSTARRLSMEPGYLSPFARQAREAGMIPPDAPLLPSETQVTGKVDDTTCIVAVATTDAGTFGVGSVI